MFKPNCSSSAPVCSRLGQLAKYLFTSQVLVMPSGSNPTLLVPAILASKRLVVPKTDLAAAAEECKWLYTSLDECMVPRKAHGWFVMQDILGSQQFHWKW